MAEIIGSNEYNFFWNKSKFNVFATKGSNISEFVNNVGYITSSMSSSYASTASYALTASYVENAASSEGTITYIFNGFGGTIVAGYQYDYLIVPFSCSIQNWYAVSDVVGSTEIDIWRANEAIPTASDSIVGGNYITFTSQQINSDSTLLGWTSSLNPGDILNFDVRSASLMTSLTIVMKILK